ncbi:MAG: hypothetical protein HY906_18225 [Deltaproteobacteria bacterium]|nr:hypothetical protein [Deltaproteobacteria bacterium]
MRARFVLVVAAGLLLAACGDNGTTPPPAQQDGGQDTGRQYDATNRPDTGACEDQCTANERRCVTGGFQLCGDTNGDGCVGWQVTQACPSGQKCNAASGTCETACTDACAAGSIKCTVDGSGTQACVDGAGGCREWGAAVNCPNGQTCSGGKCSATCVDECTSGSKQCSGDGFRSCGNFDSDACLDWGPVTPCPTGQTCSNGVCSAACTNECTAGAKECVSTDGFRLCGDFDPDPCLEWSDTTPCPTGQTCSNGTCSATCTDECTTNGAKECTTSGTAYRVCGNFDSDTCKEWGPETNCPNGQTCSAGECAAVCDCDYTTGICEPAAPNSTTACVCDPDCSGGKRPCVSDGYCDSWCPAGADPDCGCACDYNEYCEAAEVDSYETCACDPDCELHDWACSDDGHCDTWCPDGADPDCGVDACRSREMSIGWRYGAEMWLDGVYENPDPDNGLDWVLLSSGGWAGEGTAEMFVEFAAEHLSCVTGMKLEVYGYDDSSFGDGAEMYLWNWNTGQYDLLADQTVGWTSDARPAFFENWVLAIDDYVLCGSGAHAKCYVDAQLRASTWDNTHVWWTELWVQMSP